MRDISFIRSDFPILDSQINGEPLIYLDNAATTQIPTYVLERITAHYTQDNANVHRGIHTLSERSSRAYEQARETAAAFIHAAHSGEIVFTSGCTEAINLVACGLEHLLGPGDEVLVTSLEHHAVYVTMQQLCHRTGAEFRVLELERAAYDRGRLTSMLSSRTKLVCATQVSNLTGTVLPVREIAADVHDVGGMLLVDGAQALRHEPVDVGEIDCDFYCFSGHKLLSPAGIGVLYGKSSCLELLNPVKFGGGIVDLVAEAKTTFAPFPHRLEAGTPNYPAAMAMAAAMDYLSGLGRSEIAEREAALTRYVELLLHKIPRVHVLGRPEIRRGAVSFVVDGIDSYDIAKVLDQYGVAVRSGTHCAQPALRSLGVTGAVRVSPAFYNTEEEIEQFAEYLNAGIAFLSRWSDL